MKPFIKHLPTLITAFFCAAALIYGPITQPINYHQFADQQTILGIPHFADVLKPWFCAGRSVGLVPT